MRRVFRVLLSLIFLIFVSSCASDELMSLDQAVLEGEELEISSFEGYTKDEIIAEWGEPSLTEADKGALTFSNDNGSVILIFENDQVISAQAHTFEEPSWLFRLVSKNGTFAVAAAILAVVIPFIALFLIISLIMKKLGWLGNDE